MSLRATGGPGSSTPSPLLAVEGVINCVGGRMAQGSLFAFCATGTYPPCSGKVANKTRAGQHWVLVGSCVIAWEWVLWQHITCWDCRAGANRALGEGFCAAPWLFWQVYGLPSNRVLCESWEVRGFVGLSCQVSQCTQRYLQLELWSEIPALPARPGLPQGCSNSYPALGFLFLGTFYASCTWTWALTPAPSQVCVHPRCVPNCTTSASRMSSWAFFLTLGCCCKRVWLFQGSWALQLCVLQGRAEGFPAALPRSWD